MRLSLFRGPLLLLLWQTAPVSVQRDSAGRVQVALGFGGGQFENRSLSCEGEVLSSAPAPFTVAGAQVDAWLADNARLSGFGGALTSAGRTEAFGGVQVALEGRGAGIGIGVAAMPWSAIDPDYSSLYPSGYLRFGSRERAHFRLDLVHPTPTPGATGDVLRVGVGFNQGLLHTARWFVGYNAGPFSDESHVGGLFGEAEFPVSPRLDLGVGASWRPSESSTDASARALVRYHLGR